MEAENERKSVEIEIPLDPAHRRMDLALRERGVNVENALSEEVTPYAENALHDLLQAVKYEDKL